VRSKPISRLVDRAGGAEHPQMIAMAAMNIIE
jgi:hypothetical protein